MTAQEKAKEVVDKFYKEIGLSDLNVLPSMNLSLESETKTLAKQCAIIAVDELIESYRDGNDNYWQQVKTEIEKI